MRIQQWTLDKIRPYPNNPRVNDDAVEAVAKSINSFGFRQPVVVDTDGTIICGHTRFKAAQRLGLDKIPVHVAKDLTAEQIKAYRIADNKTAELAEWNPELLTLELSDLLQQNYDIGMLGFDDDELAALLEPEVKDGLTDPDNVPAPPDEAVTQPGDLWILGNHRLLCGDSAKPEDVDRLLDGATIDFVNTDPPYGVCVSPRSNNAIAAGLSSFGGTEKTKPTAKKLRAKDRPLINDFVSDEEFIKLLNAWFENIARVLKPGGSFFIWGGYANLGNYPPVLEKYDLYFSQAIVWDKEFPVISRKDYMGCFELAFYGWRRGAGHKFYGPNNAQDLWHVKKVSPQKMEHLTQKPNELAVRAIQYSSKKKENVLDLFGGSGSTLLACEQTRRHCYTMELDQLYADIVVNRWESFTGSKAERVRAQM